MPLDKEANYFRETFDGITESAENADEAISGTLASFDKFNVLGGQSSGSLGGDIGITQALTEELERQQKIYEEQLAATADINNQAKEVANTIKGWFIKTDSEGNFLYDENGLPELTSEAIVIIGVFKGIASAINEVSDALKNLAKIFDPILNVIGSLFGDLELDIEDVAKLVKLSIEIGITMMTGGVYLILKYWDEIVAGFKIAIDWIKKAFETLGDWFVELGNKIKDFFVGIWVAIANGFAKIINGIANGFIGFVNFLIDGLNLLLSPIDKIAGIFGGNVKIPNWEANVNWQPYPEGFANGGITDANLIMTHENGVREWVGRQGNSTAVVNDSQMTDVMYQAVRNGVLDAFGMINDGSDGTQPINVNVTIGGESIFKETRKEAKRNGYDFMPVK